MKSLLNQVAVPSILEIKPHALFTLGETLKKHRFSKALLIVGSGLEEIVIPKLSTSLKDSGINLVQIEILDTIDLVTLLEHAFTLPTSCDVIIGAGGGKAIDASKYIAHLKKIPFISVPTSTATDSFSSSSCSLLVQGKRMSIQSTMPYGVIIDLDILQGAPTRFIYSGIGDVVSNMTAILDWQFESHHKDTSINDFSVLVSKTAFERLVQIIDTPVTELNFLTTLAESLMLSGITTEIAGNSSPTSGSEHLISHALDQYTTMNQLHGIQVGIATYLVSAIQNKPLHQLIESVLTKTGFFHYVQSLQLSPMDFETAIKRAPSIKPNRFTYVHDKNYQEQLVALLKQDSLLHNILS